MIFLLFFSYSYPFIVFFVMVDSLGCMHCWMLHIASVCTTCCMLLRVVGSCCAKFGANNSQHCCCFMIAEASHNNVGSVCTALLTFLGPRALITKGVQRLMGCILPTMQCRPQHCWDMLHPFAHHCQHGRNNFQHCWPSNVESCYVRL